MLPHSLFFSSLAPSGADGFTTLMLIDVLFLFFLFYPSLLDVLDRNNQLESEVLVQLMFCFPFLCFFFLEVYCLFLFKFSLFFVSSTDLEIASDIWILDSSGSFFYVSNTHT